MNLRKVELCELCNGTGWIAEHAGLQAHPCVCQKDQRREQKIAAAAIPPRYIHCRLANLNDRGNLVLKNARRRIQEFVECWPGDRTGKGFLIMGGCGVGKTHLAVATLLEIMVADKPGNLLFSNFQDLIQAIHASFSSDEAPSKSEILRPLLDAELLVVDELGSQTPTSFVREILYYLINTRYNNIRPTIFTTNYFDPPVAKEQTLEERVGSALRSRLYEMTERIVIDSSVSDYRKSLSRAF
jgi:DNA replication protein DnaC